MKKAVIVVAGGSGKRMGSEIPKQFLILSEMPILMHTIKAFYGYEKKIQIVVVLPKNQIEYWQKLCKDYNFEIAHKIVAGGKERFFSVKNGLSEIDKTVGLVAIHDGVRPYVSEKIIADGFEIANKLDNAIAATKVKDSYRFFENDSFKPINRDNLRIIQTPQIFKKELITKAYEQDFSPEFTDDATVLEKLGYKINLYDGSDQNIKITTPADLRIKL